MDSILEKFDSNLISKIDKENADKIILFLFNEKCEYIEDIITDYIDIFTIDYDTFVKKFDKLNQKHNGYFLKKAGEDMNMLEELFNAR